MNYSMNNFQIFINLKKFYIQEKYYLICTDEKKKEILFKVLTHHII